MLPVAALSHVCGIFFSVTERRVQHAKFNNTRRGRTVPIPRRIFGTSNVYLSRVWAMTPDNGMRKFVVFFTAVIGPLRDDRPRVDKALVFATSDDGGLYLCFRDIAIAQLIIASVVRHIAITRPDAVRVARICLDDLA